MAQPAARGIDIRPQDERQLAEVVAWAVSSDCRLAVTGGGSRRFGGRPMQCDYTLDLSAMTGVTLYEPEELVLSAHAATPLHEIETLLEENNQQLAFEPVDLGPLFGSRKKKRGGTLGGMLATNLSGPRRFKAGAARDHFLGFRAVSGRGEIFKSGGRVVKNVTGYDMCKGLAGSWGTLAVMSQVTLKVLPAAECSASLIVRGLDSATAVRVMTEVLQSSCDVSGAAHLPAALAARCSIDEIASTGTAATVFRIEGIATSVAFRTDQLAEITKRHGVIARADDAATRRFWQDVRDVRFLASPREQQVWRLSVPPSKGAAVMAEIAGEVAGCKGYFDWGGGLVWLGVPAADDAQVETVRRAVAKTGGHALLVRASAQVRAEVEVFQPLEETLAALTRRIKAGFDPKGILNPGRMYANV